MIQRCSTLGRHRAKAEQDAKIAAKERFPWSPPNRWDFQYVHPPKLIGAIGL